MKRGLATIAFAAVVLTVGNYARADECTKEQKATSKMHFDEGAKAFRLNNLNKAADAFKAAYDACPLPLFLYNLGQTYRQLKDNEQALYFYKQFLSSTDATDYRRHDVEQWISQLKEQIESQKRLQEAPPPGPEPPSTAATTPATSPPSSEKTSTRSDLTASKEAPPRKKSIAKQPWFWGVIGAVAVGVGVGLGVGLGTQSHPPKAGSEVQF